MESQKLGAQSTSSSEGGAGRGLRPLGTLAFACAVITAINGLYMLLAAVGNITDFETNLAFVRHVLSMDTTNFGATPGTELDPDVMWRAIDSQALQTVAYVAIILWEALAACILAYATFRWVAARRSRSFETARRFSSTGFIMVVALFMGGFMTVGGEWFQMWRSEAWNGLDPAFRNTVLALFGLVLVHLPSEEWRT